MKTFVACVVCCVLSAQTRLLSAPQTNLLRPRPLTVLPSNQESAPLPWGTRTNLAAAGWSKVKQLKPRDSVGTNTPAFNNWAVNFMLTQANLVLTNWGLERNGPVTTNDTTWYYYPSQYGLCGSIATTDGRYLWGFSYGKMDAVHDEDYFGRTLAYSEQKSAELAKVKSLITKTEARKIAEDALHALGFTPALLGVRARPTVTQYNYEIGGKQLPLPLFRVVWTDPDDDENRPVLDVEVSGILKKVVSYSNYARHTPRFPLPTNYFEMLGIKP